MAPTPPAAPDGNPSPQSDEGPEVSPDGQTVTFIRHKVGGKLQALYAVDIDGSDVRRLTTYRLEVAIKPDWAPNGRQIVLASHADYPDHKSPNVATIKPDGSHLRMLTDHRGGEREPSPAPTPRTGAGSSVDSRIQTGRVSGCSRCIPTAPTGS